MCDLVDTQSCNKMQTKRAILKLKYVPVVSRDRKVPVNIITLGI